MRKLGDPHGMRFEAFDKVVRCRLAIECGIHCEDNLIDVTTGDPRDKRVDAQILGTNAIERGEPPAKNMELARKEPRPLKRPKIGDVLHNTEHTRIAAGIGAYSARTGCIDIAADFAGRELVTHPFERAEQRHQRPFALFQQVQHRTSGRSRPKARKPRKGLHQCFDLMTCHHTHDRGLRIVLPRG